MLINGVDLSVLGIQLYDRILESNSVDTSQEWLEGDIQPTFIRQQDKFKNIQLKFLVLKDNEAEAFLVMSKLTSMLKKASIIFDDIDLVFDVTMRGPASQSRLKTGTSFKHLIYEVIMQRELQKSIQPILLRLIILN